MSEQIEVGADYHLRKVGQLYRAATGERDRLKAELAKLQAEREPRDNGDGTETAMLPVTYQKGLDVAEARSRRTGDTYVGVFGETSVSEVSDNREYNIFLILRPAPEPPESVTWEANLSDGEHVASERGITSGAMIFYWATAQEFLVKKPAKLGLYLFKDGVGTLIEESK